MAKPLSLALIRGRYAPDGGAERFVSRVLESLGGQGPRVTLITREWTPGSGFEVVVVNPFYLGRLWRDWSFARAVRKLLRTRAFDIVQSHERIPGCDIYRAGDGVHREWLQQRARTLSSWGRLLQTLSPYHCYIKHAEKRVFTSSLLRVVICNSEMVKTEIQRHFGLPPAKLQIIHNGVDTDVFHPRLKQHRAAVRAQYKIPETATLFLFVGSGFERKGVPILLEVMTRMPEQAWLLIVGRDKKMKGFQRRSERLGLSRRVIFAGSQADVKPYYGAANVLVLPTLYDPFSNVVLEAMASGLPVITSTKSGAAEVIENGKTGFVCDALDSTALAQAMNDLCAAENSSAMGQAAHERVSTLSLKHMSERLLELYRSILRAV